MIVYLEKVFSYFSIPSRPLREAWMTVRTKDLLYILSIVLGVHLCSSAVAAYVHRLEDSWFNRGDVICGSYILLALWVFSYLFRQYPMVFDLNSGRKSYHMIWVALVWLCVIVASFLGSTLDPFFDKGFVLRPMMMGYVGDDCSYRWILIALGSGIFVIEMISRGVVWNYLYARYSLVVTYVVTALVYGIMLSWFLLGYFSPIWFIGSLITSCLLSFLYHKTHSLWVVCGTYLFMVVLMIVGFCMVYSYCA